MHLSICSFLLKLRRLNATNEMHCSKAIQLNGKFNSSFLINYFNIANHMKGLKASMLYHYNIVVILIKHHTGMELFLSLGFNCNK